MSGVGEPYLEAVIDVQTRHHHQEAVRVDASDKRGDHEAVPALVRVVEDAVDGVRAEQGYGDQVQVAESDLVVFLGLLLGLGELVLVLEGNPVGNHGVWRGVSDTDVDRFGDLPELENDAHALAEEYHPGGAVHVVHEVEEDDRLHGYVCEDGSDGDANVVLFVSPMRLRLLILSDVREFTCSQYRS